MLRGVKENRHFATRYDTLAVNFLAFVTLAFIRKSPASVRHALGHSLGGMPLLLRWLSNLSGVFDFHRCVKTCIERIERLGGALKRDAEVLVPLVS